MSSIGTMHLEVELLAHPRVDDGHVAGPAGFRRSRRGTARSHPAAAASPRARSAGAAAAVSAARRSSDSIRCAPRLVAAMKWISSTITVVDAAERLARVRGQHQVERLGRRDQDVGRSRGAAGGAHGRPCPRSGRRPSARGGAASRAARPPPGCPSAARGGSSRRRPRAPAAARCTGPGSALRSRGAARGHPVDRPQERRQGLARTRRREQQRVVARGDRRPALRWASVGSPNEPRTNAARRERRSRGPRMNHATRSFGHRCARPVCPMSVTVLIWSGRPRPTRPPPRRESCMLPSSFEYHRADTLDEALRC